MTDNDTEASAAGTPGAQPGKQENKSAQTYVQAPGLTQVQKALLYAEQSKNAPQPEAVGEIAPEDALPEVKLADLPAVMQEACARAGWPGLMPVQEKALPYMLAGRDIMVQARTGSGKTGAFLLPLLGRLKTAHTSTQALILVPTRELAQQVAADAATLFEGTGIECVAVYGGVGYGAQLEAFKRGAQIVVGTPGRVLDHLLKRSLSLSELSTLIFDEADRMLSIGFYPDMKDIQRYLPRPATGRTSTRPCSRPRSPAGAAAGAGVPDQSGPPVALRGAGAHRGHGARLLRGAAHGQGPLPHAHH